MAYKGIKNKKMIKTAFITSLKTMAYDSGLTNLEKSVIFSIELRETL
tara:strand:- start:3521 stop:3661 length:141 start_codon:yes stop_codon:yes gene_type:complete